MSALLSVDQDGINRVQLEIADEIADCYADPLRHTLLSYPWGEGSLEGRDGPNSFQRGYLIELGQEVRNRAFNGVDPVEPIRFSTASGHSIGKSALVAMIIRWIMDTRPDARGTVTANTSEQLRTRTWAELSKWHQLGLTNYLYDYSVSPMRYQRKSNPSGWFVAAYTAEERNSESFAGQHTAHSTSFYIFDEASGVPEPLFNVREGGLVRGEPQVHDFGNPTRNTGRFYENMLGRFRDEFRRRFVDSRDVEGTNLELFERWRQLYGEESDFFKVRVLGQFPDQGALQFIPSSVARACVGVEVAASPEDPVVIGVDVARFGDDNSVIHQRRGRDNTTPQQIFSGLNTMQLAARVVALADEIKPDAVFIDGGGVGGGVVDRCLDLNLPVIEVNFGAKATEADDYGNMRAQCWGRLRAAMRDGIALPDDPDLIADLTGLEFGYNPRNQILLERKEDAKKRGIKSPDRADALALSYALPVFPQRLGGYAGVTDGPVATDYNPYD